MQVKAFIAVLLSTVVLCSCVYTLHNLILFVSSHSILRQERFTLLSNILRFDSPWPQVVTDVFLMCLFIVQHSLQDHTGVKTFLSRNGLNIFERLVYNLGSCAVLQILMQLWNPVTSWVVWDLQTSRHPFIWWVFVIIHFAAWLLVFSGCYIMDLTELLGVKQVFHGIHGYPDPLSLKSAELRRLYSHFRHPSFFATIIILIVHPVVHLDRLLLAYCYGMYMVLTTQVDEYDYFYQRDMLRRKVEGLDYRQ